MVFLIYLCRGSILLDRCSSGNGHIFGHTNFFESGNKTTIHEPQCFEFEQTCIIQLGCLKEAVATCRTEELRTLTRGQVRELFLTDRAVIFPLSHTETTKKTDHFWCVTKPNAFAEPMMFCINFRFEFYFPKCLLKEHWRPLLRVRAEGSEAAKQQEKILFHWHTMPQFHCKLLHTSHSEPQFKLLFL